MAIDAYVYFEGDTNAIKGETLDAEMSQKNGFDIEAFGFGITNPVNVGSGTGGLGSGRAEFEKFTFTKKTDTGTCATILSCCAGTHHKAVHLIIRKGGAAADSSGGEFVHVTMTDVVIESITWNGSDGDEAFSDEVTCAYAQIKFQYWQQDMAGKLSKPKDKNQHEMSWNQTTNKVAA